MLEELLSLTRVFNNTLFRIPDYQRGFAWENSGQNAQLSEFWDDLLNLDLKRGHYTGVLTVKRIPSRLIAADNNMRWLLDNDYSLFHVIDGQQRLTACIILLQCIAELVREKNGINDDLHDRDIEFNQRTLENIVQYFLRSDRPDKIISTYKFGYAEDNHSDLYFRFRIMNEREPGTLQESYYTLNMDNAKVFFAGQLQAAYLKGGIPEIEDIFKRLVIGLKFNFYVIPDEFDEFVAFETMNNRGKRLSYLELLKNRLIYLSTLYTDQDADAIVKKELRDSINLAWKEIYHQLGREKQHPLSDDDFLKAHWMMYFGYSRKRGSDYISFLLNEHFTPSRVFERVAVPVQLQMVDELKTSAQDDSVFSGDEAPTLSDQPRLKPKEKLEYVSSLRCASKAWYCTYYPTPEIAPAQSDLIEKLNRLPASYSRPLVMSLLMRSDSDEANVPLLQAIERFLFVCFRVNSYRTNYGSAEFLNAARSIYWGKETIERMRDSITILTEQYFTEGHFDFEAFKKQMNDRFTKGYQQGFYGWPGLAYFLYEYELDLMASRGQSRLSDRQLFLRHTDDRISIEHIYPQTPTETYWRENFPGLTEKRRSILANSLGNLLPLSQSINSSLQNDSFLAKKHGKYDAEGQILRNGYENGSYSEQEVSRKKDWTPQQILERGLKLLKFMEKRWNIRLGRREDKFAILGLSFMLPTDGSK